MISFLIGKGYTRSSERESMCEKQRPLLGGLQHACLPAPGLTCPALGGPMHHPVCLLSQQGRTRTWSSLQSTAPSADSSLRSYRASPIIVTTITANVAYQKALLSWRARSQNPTSKRKVLYKGSPMSTWAQTHSQIKAL